ncbi:hypothetical protein [Synechococcus sp. CBW1006]|uniref:hypothetical protein n=1 Tax=Synechococcus sp. CBW1006 TaxID=1353138 RepID=UPI0018CD1587|nr:hypothetical protein [Synechococcus sp. CBW1006]QPN67537.1 hypothetical protein H8F26_04960 [Synechococcus sp. CBW1006]
MAWLCRQLGVARSGDYAWRHRQEAPGQRAAENAVITAEIQAVFHEHHRREVLISPQQLQRDLAF